MTEAIAKFRTIYIDKTGNHFGRPVQKRASKFYHLHIEEATAPEIQKQFVKSQLNEGVLNTMTFLFDETIMRDTLISFNIDLHLMPLGKVTQLEIAGAFYVLARLKILLSRRKTKAQRLDRELLILELSNQFYSYIPHAFDIRRPEKIDTLALHEAKCEMLYNLKKVQFAYGLAHSAAGHLENPYDECYRKLNTILQPLEKDSEDHKMICEYACNSHAPYHTNYSLEVLNTFAVERIGEKERFAEFAKMSNRMLLWHGSRLTNFASILSNGLKIAPPGVVLAGHYFGKGIYFADMISKSANYCRHQLKNNVGFLLLCEVALGNMQEHKKSFPMKKLPKNYNSLKGIGNTFLDSSKSIQFQNKFNVPLGKPITDQSIMSKLRHNEYVVYDESQVNIKYLVQVKFLWNK